jgi:hypothetical protein
MKRVHWPSIQPEAATSAPSSLVRRLAWMAVIWGASVGVLGIVAMLLRWVIR